MVVHLHWWAHWDFTFRKLPPTPMPHTSCHDKFISIMMFSRLCWVGTDLLSVPQALLCWGPCGAFSCVTKEADVSFPTFLQSFERVLVENKLHGLSPELSGAIQSISRWELVQAALPHVLHCTSILLSNRNKLGEGCTGVLSLIQGCCYIEVKSPNVPR